MNRFFLFVLLSALWTPNPSSASDQDVVQELANVQLPESPLEDPPPESIAAARTERLQKALRCPVCQGLSVSDSPSDAARAMGNRIEELVEEGYTEEQVTDYFVDRYGAWVELEPPPEEHRALFIAPVIILAVGLLLLVAWARGRKASPQERTSNNDNPPMPTPNPDLAPWRERILAELDGGPR